MLVTSILKEILEEILKKLLKYIGKPLSLLYTIREHERT